MFILALFCGQASLSAQQSKIIGRVVDASSKETIRFAHIENYTSHATTFTDTSGTFSLNANEGDTLIFSAIGYYYKKVIVLDTFLNNLALNIFELSGRIYELTEANIYLPGTYQQFKHDFIELDIPETETGTLRKELAAIAISEGKKAYDEAIAQGRLEPPKPGVKILSSDEKARLRFREYLGQKEKQKIIDEKYNADVVTKVTGLTDDDEIISFMLFCNFTEEYLLEVNPLDLMEKISQKYEEYRKKNTG